MHVIEVAPLSRGSSLDTLTYFSHDWYPRGTILKVPVRNSMTQAVVLGASEASKTKTALRAATFTLRRLPAQETTAALPTELIEVAEYLSHYYATTLGAMLFSLLPSEIKKGVLPIHTYESHTLPYEFEYKLLTEVKAHRHTEYQSLIRESFARAHSIHMVAPTAVDIDILITELGSGIEEHVVVLESGLPLKKLRDAWETLRDMSHPKLIITTPQYGFIERGDIRAVVLERARAGSYRAQQRPYVDYRHAFYEHAKRCKRILILGDSVHRSEDIKSLRDGVAEPYQEQPKRLILKGQLETKLMLYKPDSAEPFKLFSDELLGRLHEVVDKKASAFLFAARRGLAPVVACVDCGYILRAPESGAPLSLHRFVRDGVEERWLICSVSGYRERARDLCPQCGSWRLKERGIGIQQMYDVLTEHIAPEHITLFDYTTARTHKKAQQLMSEFYGQKGSILLGTSLALPYLLRPVTTSAITSMEALRSIPSWKQQEEIFSILMTLREKTEGTVYIQTRTTDTDAVEYAEKGRLDDFYDEELGTREQFHYPPFAVFVHLTWMGTREAAKKMDEEIKETFAPYNVTTYASVTGSQEETQEKITRQALIRVTKNDWPHDDIIAKLRALPPHVRIMIDPDRIV